MHRKAYIYMRSSHPTVMACILVGTLGAEPKLSRPKSTSYKNFPLQAVSTSHTEAATYSDSQKGKGSSDNRALQRGWTLQGGLKT